MPQADKKIARMLSTLKNGNEKVAYFQGKN
jgi:hypothetical protein